MKTWQAAIALVVGFFASPDANAQGAKYVVTGRLTACAVAIADATTGKAGGGETGEMTVTCTLANRGRSWDCVTAYPNEAEKSQYWSLTSKIPCEVSAKTATCALTNATGSLRIVVATNDGSGIMQLRLDMDAGSPVAVKACAGTLTMGTGAGWFCGPSLCSRDRSDCTAAQAAFSESFPEEKSYKDPCVVRPSAYCIFGEQMCFMDNGLCERISKAKDGKRCVKVP